MPSHDFHPEARIELADATEYYFHEASPRVAKAFSAAVESAIRQVLESPNRWRVVEQPEIRRYVFRRFPYALYYQWNRDREHVRVYAVMHCSRKPGYWKHRLT